MEALIYIFLCSESFKALPTTAAAAAVVVVDDEKKKDKLCIVSR
jgi:hypothetical protein